MARTVAVKAQPERNYCFYCGCRRVNGPGYAGTHSADFDSPCLAPMTAYPEMFDDYYLRRRTSPRQCIGSALDYNDVVFATLGDARSNSRWSFNKEGVITGLVESGRRELRSLLTVNLADEISRSIPLWVRRECITVEAGQQIEATVDAFRTRSRANVKAAQTRAASADRPLTRREHAETMFDWAVDNGWSQFSSRQTYMRGPVLLESSVSYGVTLSIHFAPDVRQTMAAFALMRVATDLGIRRVEGNSRVMLVPRTLEQLIAINEMLFNASGNTPIVLALLALADEVKTEHPGTSDTLRVLGDQASQLGAVIPT